MHFNRPRCAATAALFGVTFMLGCADSLTGPGASELQSAERKWNKRGLTSYRILEGAECFCSSVAVYEVTVVAGVVTAATDTTTHQAVSSNQLKELATVPQLFDRARAGIRDGTLAEARYDGDTGMPTWIYLDFDRQAVDDEMGFRAKFLAALQ